MTARSVIPARSRRTEAGRVVAGVVAAALVVATAPLLVVLFTGDEMHRTHEITVILFTVVLVAGSLISVAVRPTSAPGALRVVLAAGAGALVTAALTPRVDPIGIVLVGIAVGVNATGRFGMWRGDGTWHLRRWEATLPALLVAGFWPFILEQIRLQAAGPPLDEHVAFGHYALMASILLGIAFAGLVGTSNVEGNHVAGTLAGTTAVLVGLGSLVTDSVSAFGLPGELALITGGFVFVWMVQLERMGLHPQPPRPGDGRVPPRAG